MSYVLDPLAARYATWLGLPAHETGDTADEDPSQVRAMPVILRIERQDPPARTAVLEAAAAAAVAVCLADVPEWQAPLQAWIDGRIRKVSRRARGAHWDAVQALPGVTISVDGAEARALVPCLVVETPKEVTRLQISGSELPTDEPGPVPPDTPVLWLNPTVEMTAGKAAAQVGHASMLLAALIRDETYFEKWVDYRCAVRTPTREAWAELLPGPDPAAAWRDRGVVAVRDAGFTEVAPGTVTVIAQRS